MSATERARPLALACVVITALGAVYAAVSAIAAIDPSWGFAANAILHLGELAGVLAIVVSGAAGTRTMGRIGLTAAVLGELALVAAELVDPVSPAVSEPMFSIASLLIGLGMFLAGVTVLRARRWSGWHRATPLVIGIVTVVVLIPAMAITGGPPSPGALWAIVVWELCYVLLGAAALAESPTTERQPVAA